MINTKISPHAVVETDQIGENVTIHEFAVIRKNVVIGDGVTIHPGVVIEEGVVIEAGTEIFPGCYIGKTPKGVGATARPISFRPVVKIGRDCAIGPYAVIFYDVEIGGLSLVGDGVSIREGCQVGTRCVIGRHVTVNYNTQIGDETKIMDHTWLAGNMSVGSHVFISGGVMTANDNAMGMAGYNEQEVIGPQIEDWACIGVGAILLPNIRVGHHALVGAGAVATKDIDPYCVVKGIPARISGRIANDDTEK
jgi:acetyltransferase-like isoleucine patch superfamily enzyme